MRRGGNSKKDVGVYISWNPEGGWGRGEGKPRKKCPQYKSWQNKSLFKKKTKKENWTVTGEIFSLTRRECSWAKFRQRKNFPACQERSWRSIKKKKVLEEIVRGNRHQNSDGALNSRRAAVVSAREGPPLKADSSLISLLRSQPQWTFPVLSLEIQAQNYKTSFPCDQVLGSENIPSPRQWSQSCPLLPSAEPLPDQRSSASQGERTDLL